MNAMSAATRKQQERERKRKAGFALVQEWVPQDDVERMRKYAIKLRKAHLRKACVLPEV